MFGRRHHGDLPDGAALDHREHMASWSVHFACMVVYAEAIVLEVLVREQNFLRLRKEQPGLAEAQDNYLPLVGLQLKGQVSVSCNLGLAEQTLQLRTPGVFAHDVFESVGDRDLHLCVGVCIADGVCNEEIFSKGCACAGDA
jgi:hypothetical protein